METTEELSQITAKSIKYRGEIIHHICVVEGFMEQLISTYFCGFDMQKAFHLKCAMLGHNSANLMYKMDIVKFIIGQEMPTQKAKNAPIFKGMVSAIEYRNKIAHVPINLIKENNNGELHFLYYSMEAAKIAAKKYSVSEDIIKQNRTKTDAMLDLVIRTHTQICNKIMERGKAIKVKG